MHSGSFQHQVLLRDLPVSGSPLTAASSKGVSSTLASSGQKDTKNFIHGILLISVFSLFKRDFSHLKPSLPLAEDQTILSLHPKLPRPFLAPAVTPRVSSRDSERKLGNLRRTSRPQQLQPPGKSQSQIPAPRCIPKTLIRAGGHQAREYSSASGWETPSQTHKNSGNWVFFLK